MRSPTRPRSCSKAAFARSSCGSAIRRCRGSRRRARGEASASRHDIALMVDYNQALGRRRGAGARPRARPRGHRLAGGADPPRRLRRRGDARARARTCRSRSARIFRWSPACRPRSTPAPAICVMPDLERIGGVTGWLRRRGARRRAQHQDVIASLFRRRARICSRRRRPRISSNTSTGPTRSCRSRCRSSTATPSFPTGRATASSGTRQAVERYRV